LLGDVLRISTLLKRIDSAGNGTRTDVHQDRSASHPDTSGIGDRLRNAREARGLTLAAAESLTRIRAVYLQALEDEQFDRMPGPVYARGYLRTYALALGLAPDELMETYPAAFGAADRPVFTPRPAQIPIRPTTPPSRLRRVMMYVGGAILTIVLILGFIGYQQLRQFAQPVPPSVSAPVAEPVPPPAPPKPASVSPQAKPTVVSAPQPAGNGGVELAVAARGSCWLYVVADGVEVFQGLVQAGDAPTWHARQRLTVRVGNVDVVALRVNGQLVQPQTQGKVWEGTFTAP
jgi:hypothetical protein